MKSLVTNLNSPILKLSVLSKVNIRTWNKLFQRALFRHDYFSTVVFPLSTNAPATMSSFPKARLERLEHVSECVFYVPARAYIMCYVSCALRRVCVCVRGGSKVCSCSLGLGQTCSLEGNLECGALQKPYLYLSIYILWSSVTCLVYGLLDFTGFYNNINFPLFSW